jgi:hypothetical protein
MRPCTRELPEDKSSLERQTLYMVQTQNTNFPTQSTLDGVVVF